MDDLFITITVFAGLYFIFKSFTDFLLKRKIVKTGHFDKAAILEQKQIEQTGEPNHYSSLKWGLVALMTGIGFIIVDQLRFGKNYEEYFESMMPWGIILVFISLGFLIYFMIANYGKKK